MRFEFDSRKNETNRERHGIFLQDAQKLWERDHVIIPAKNVQGESRFAIVGRMAGKHYVAVFTERNGVIRCISCHRADRRWERIYEKYIRQGTT